MTVSVALVTRNHETFVGRTIASTAGLANEVVVVDTGSTDGTRGAVTAAGGRVVPFTWANDFSAACNAALASATGEWVLWLNPDEELDPAAVPVLASAARNPAAFAYRVQVQQQLRADTPGRGSPDWQIRLFRRDPGVKYRGRVHPDFDVPIPLLAGARGALVANLAAVVRRHAYLSPPTPDKIRWVNTLLEAELADRPELLHVRIELGRNLLLVNDPRGHDVLTAAANRVAAATDALTPPSPAVGSLFEYLLALPGDTGPLPKLLVRTLAAKWFPATPPVVWALAQERFRAGDFAAAAGPLERLLAMGRSGEYDPAGGFDPDIVGPAAAVNLGIAYVRLGRREEAYAAYAAAAGHPVFGAQAARGMAATAAPRPAE